MVAQVFTHAGQMVRGSHAGLLQDFSVADAGELQQLR